MLAYVKRVALWRLLFLVHTLTPGLMEKPLRVSGKH
jgi:hypothetical protein